MNGDDAGARGGGRSVNTPSMQERRNQLLLILEEAIQLLDNMDSDYDS